MVGLAKRVDEYNVPVLCYGLRVDFMGKLFEGSYQVMAMADSIDEIKTICWCGKKATHNARYNENGIVKNGNQIELGGNDTYIALCRKHYEKGDLGSGDE